MYLKENTNLYISGHKVGGKFMLNHSAQINCNNSKRLNPFIYSKAESGSGDSTLICTFNTEKMASISIQNISNNLSEEKVSGTLRKEMNSGDTTPCNLSISSSLSKRSNSGRNPGNVAYRHVLYNNNKYVIATIMHNGNDINFVIDHGDFNMVSDHTWHMSSGKYLGTNVFLQDGIVKEVYLHNFLLKGAVPIDHSEKEYVIHINKNTLDNRRANLRLVNGNEHALLKVKKKRIITLPGDCGLSSDDIPKHICYVKANGNHGDRFSVELPTEGIYWKTSSSKKFTLAQKLQEAKKKLDELYIIYPHLNPIAEKDTIERLETEFLEIMKVGSSEPSYKRPAKFRPDILTLKEEEKEEEDEIDEK